jgi:hypothetical protein
MAALLVAKFHMQARVLKNRIEKYLTQVLKSIYLFN